MAQSLCRPAGLFLAAVALAQCGFASAGYYPLFQVYRNATVLGGKVLNFEIHGDGYRYCMEDHGGIPVSTFESEPLALHDNGSRRVLFRPSFRFPFFGAEYSEMFVSSNGYITFSQAVANPDTSVEEHVGRAPRIAALTHDLDPGAGKRAGDERPAVSVKQVTGETVAVTYDNVMNSDGSGPSTLQVLLHCDGAIQIYYEQVRTSDHAEALVGLSSGQEVLYKVEESDFATPCGGLPEEEEAGAAQPSPGAQQPPAEMAAQWWDPPSEAAAVAAVPEASSLATGGPRPSKFGAADQTVSVFADSGGAAETSVVERLLFAEIGEAVGSGKARMYTLVEDVLSAVWDEQLLIESAAELLLLPERFGPSMIVTALDSALAAGASWSDFREVSSRIFSSCDTVEKEAACRDLVRMAAGSLGGAAEVKRLIRDLVVSVEAARGLEGVLHLGARNGVSPASMAGHLVGFVNQTLTDDIAERMEEAQRAIRRHDAASQPCPWGSKGNGTQQAAAGNAKAPGLLDDLIKQTMAQGSTGAARLAESVLANVSSEQRLRRSAGELLMLPGRFGPPMLVAAFDKVLQSGAGYGKFSQISSGFLAACTLEDKLAASRDLVSLAAAGEQEGASGAQAMRALIADLVASVEPRYAIASVVYLGARHAVPASQMTSLMLDFGMPPLVEAVSHLMGSTQLALAKHTPANCPGEV